MKGYRPITVMKLVDLWGDDPEPISASPIAASGNLDSVIVDLREIMQRGVLSLFYVVAPVDGMADPGTLQLEYMVSATRDGAFVTPGGVSPLGTNLSGSGVIQFTPKTAPFIKIKMTEDGGIDGIRPKLYLFAQ